MTEYPIAQVPRTEHEVVIEYPNTFSPENVYIHRLYVAEYGNPNGIPLIFLHGGPGAGHDPKWQRFFNPDKYRIIFSDQRSCGKSTPYAEWQKNTLADLVDDIEKIRTQLGIKQWGVVGGRSFGSTLALEYAKANPQKLKHLLLASVFFGDKDGANHIGEAKGAVPYEQKYFDAYQDLVPKDQRDKIIDYYYLIMTSGTPEMKLEAAKRFMMWDISIAGANIEEVQSSIDAVERNPADEIAITTLFMHYAVQEFRNRTPDDILKSEALKDIPMTIVHGCLDRITPFVNALRLKSAFPNAVPYSCTHAGHSGNHPQMIHATRMAADEIARSLG